LNSTINMSRSDKEKAPTPPEQHADESSPNNDDATKPSDDDDDDDTHPETDPTAQEALAIAQAMASADASYIPSPSLLASDDPLPLLSQVDGPSLQTFSNKPSVYQAKSVPISLRSKFDVPIHVSAGGSVVEYEISTETYDIAFGVTAEREEGITHVKETTRVDSHVEPVTGKFLVGSVPCALVFSFDNEYSWFREKRVTYKITVTPPREENVVKGRRLRAKKALEVVRKERGEVEDKYQTAAGKRAELEDEIFKLEKELVEKKKSLEVVKTEEAWLEKRRGVRDEQIKLLAKRLEKGWEDEKSEA